MIYMFGGLVVIAVLACVAIKYGNDNDNAGIIFLGAILTVFSIVGAIGFIILGFDYKASSFKAEIINREYGTNYTSEEIFYAGDVIDTIRQIDRQRIELDANVTSERQGEK